MNKVVVWFEKKVIEVEFILFVVVGVLVEDLM